jgi:hypothetical protein
LKDQVSLKSMLDMDETLLDQLEMKDIGSMDTRLRFPLPLNTMIMSNIFVHWCQKGSEIRSDEMQRGSEMQVIWIIFLSIDAKGGVK